MALNIAKSVSYPQQDSQVWTKTAIGSLLMGPGALLLAPPVLAWGYSMGVMKNALDGMDDTRLPDWTNWGELFVRGFSALLIGLACYLPASLLAAVSLIPTQNGQGGLSGLVGLPLKLGALVLFLGGCGLMPMSLARFVHTGSLGAAFNLKQVLAEIKKSLNDYALLVAALVIVVVGITGVAWLLNWFPLVGHLLSGVVSVVLAFYSTLVFSNWTGRLYRAYFVNVESPVNAVNPLAASGPAPAPARSSTLGSMRRLRDGGGPADDSEDL